MLWNLLFFLGTLFHIQADTVQPAGPSTDSLTVYFFLLDDCVISQYYTPEFTRLYEKYRSEKVGFIGYFPNFISKPDKIEAFAKTFHLEFPLKQDYYKDWTRKFGITVTPEVAVWDHRENRLLYRGRVDDSYVRVGKRNLHPKNRDLEDVIETWLHHQSAPDTIVTQAIGCFITFTDPLSKSAAPAEDGKQ